MGYTATIRLKRDGRVVHHETQTFDRKPIARAWMERREAELAAPGGIEAAKIGNPTFGDALDRYVAGHQDMGSTKRQCLRTLRRMPIAEMRCNEIRALHWSEMAQAIQGLPQTRANYLSHAGAVVAVAKALWGFELDPAELKSAKTALRDLKLLGKSAKRERRPTIDEVGRLVDHFLDRSRRVHWAAPMAQIIVFALFSGRRQGEILRALWADLDVDGSRLLVRDMKSPGGSKGNDVWCDLPPEALRVAVAMPRKADRIFPHSADGVSTSFTEGTTFLGIDDLHFHDLRHEGISRLFEMGWTIPQVAAVSGHQTWGTLQRYAHLRQTGDRWAGWCLLDTLTERGSP